MKVPFVNYKRHYQEHADEYAQAIVECLRGGNALHHLIHFPYINRENTDKLFKRVLQLPMYPELFDEEVDYVIQTIKSYYA